MIRRWLASLLSLIQEDPAAVAVTVQALVVLLVSRFHLTSAQTGAIDGGAVAALGLIAAAFTRPFYVHALSGFIAAALTLLAAFSIHIPPGWVGAWNAVAAVVVLLWRERKTSTKAALKRKHTAARLAATPAKPLRTALLPLRAVGSRR